MPAATSHRILHIPRRFVAEEWGGTETVILEISRQQQRAGFLPEIHTSMALASRRQEVIGGIPVHRYPYCYPFLGLTDADRSALDKKGGNLLSLSLFNALRSAPDVRIFHAHALKRLGGEVRTAARWQRKPFVVSLHGGVFDVPAAELEGLVKPIKDKPEWGRLFGALFGSRRVLDDADFVLCVGRSELDKARTQLPHDRIRHLPNGVDCQRFAHADGNAFRARFGIPADAFLVLNISRIDRQKNQMLLLEGFARFLPRHPNSRLVCIGPETQPDYAEQLRSFIRIHGLESRVQLLPGFRNDDPSLIEAYHACNTFVLPSMHEPFGIVVLEAWSAGRPVVASRIGGLQSLIRQGETGLFLDPAATDPADDLAARMEELASRPDYATELAEKGRHEARSRYDWPVIHAELESVYQLAEEHCARSRAHPR